MAYEGNPEEDMTQVKEAEKEQLTRLRRAYAHTTDPAKRAELANRLAMMGEDPNEDSELDNPVPGRQSPPKVTGMAEVPDTDFNRLAAEARGLEVGATKPMPIGVESDKLPGDQEMYNHETGEWGTDVTPGMQVHFDHSKDTEEDVTEIKSGYKPVPEVRDEAKNTSEPARQEKAEAAEADPYKKTEPSTKPAAKPVTEPSDPKKREAK